MLNKDVIVAIPRKSHSEDHNKLKINNDDENYRGYGSCSDLEIIEVLLASVMCFGESVMHVSSQVPNS